MPRRAAGYGYVALSNSDWITAASFSGSVHERFPRTRGGARCLVLNFSNAWIQKARPTCVLLCALIILSCAAATYEGSSSCSPIC